MSSIDNKITYNNLSTSESNVKAKLSLTAVARYAEAGGGSKDHSQLENLDYANSGHTGFASSADLANKQDKLTAGSNINISAANIISAIIPDAKIGRNFTTNITVGHLASGTVISADTKIADLLYQILYEAPPAEPLKAFYYEGTTVATEIGETWASESITEAVKTTGIIHTYNPSAKSYIAFAYNKSLGLLKHIYENDLVSFDLINSFLRREVTYNGIVYYMYYIDEKIMAGEDKYQFLWN